MGVRVCHTLAEGIRDCDVIIMLRLQNERMSGALLPSSQEFFKSFGLTQEKLQLARPDAIVMHPGPINRGVEIDSAVVDGKQSVILPQVTFGIAVRMAVGHHARIGLEVSVAGKRHPVRIQPGGIGSGLGQDVGVRQVHGVLQWGRVAVFDHFLTQGGKGAIVRCRLTLMIA